MEAIKRAENVYFCTAAVELRSKSRIRIHKNSTTNITFVMISDIAL
jgi:hypothetical protein